MMSVTASRMLRCATTRLQPVLKQSVLPAASSRSMTVLSKESAEQYKKKNYNARQEKTGRPISPHITMYEFPIVVFSSGINRLTGFLLTVGAGGLGAIELVGGSGSALHLMQFLGEQHWFISSFLKFGISFEILYHYGGGIRHLLWDANPEMLTNSDAEKSAYVLIGGVTAASIGLAFV